MSRYENPYGGRSIKLGQNFRWRRPFDGLKRNDGDDDEREKQPVSLINLVYLLNLWIYRKPYPFEKCMMNLAGFKQQDLNDGLDINIMAPLAQEF